jgi:hypothetical protein
MGASKLAVIGLRPMSNLYFMRSLPPRELKLPLTGAVWASFHTAPSQLFRADPK